MSLLLNLKSLRNLFTRPTAENTQGAITLKLGIQKWLLFLRSSPFGLAFLIFLYPHKNKEIISSSLTANFKLQHLRLALKSYNFHFHLKIPIQIISAFLIDKKVVHKTFCLRNFQIQV